MKPYLWTLRLIAHVFNKNFQHLYALTFLTNNFMVFLLKNMVKLFIRNFNEVPLRNLTECIRNKKKMSKSWLCGFELATNHDCSHASNFSMGEFSRNVQKLCALHQARWSMSILLCSIASRHLTQRKKVWWMSFPMVYYMNSFAAIFFSRYYTLISKYPTLEFQSMTHSSNIWTVSSPQYTGIYLANHRSKGYGKQMIHSRFIDPAEFKSSLSLLLRCHFGYFSYKLYFQTIYILEKVWTPMS